MIVRPFDVGEPRDDRPRPLEGDRSEVGVSELAGQPAWGRFLGREFISC